MPPASKRLAQLIGQLGRQRGRYYTVCHRADEKLKVAGHKLTIRHCEFICESLLKGDPITLRALKEISETPPGDPTDENHDLFNSRGVAS